MDPRHEKIIKIVFKEAKKYERPTVRRTAETKDPFKILISCLLSLRTQDKNTARVSESLFSVAQTPEGISKLPIKTLEKLIFSSGYYKNKARTIKHVSNELIKRFNSEVPKTKEELLSIKGIGPKTANIVLAFAYGENVIPVDTHVNRLPNRLGLVRTKKPEQTELELMKIINQKYWQEINTSFILFSQNICLPVLPKCTLCPLTRLCQKVGVRKYR